MGTKATVASELVVKCKNEVGALAKATIPLKEAGVNIENVCCWGDGTNANFLLVTNNNAKAKTVLTKAGYTVTENPTVCCTLGNTPGTLLTATSALAENKIDINYCYCTAPVGCTTQTIVFSTNNNNKAVECLNKACSTNTTTGTKKSTGGCCG